MTVQSILLPVFVQVALIAGLLGLTIWGRASAAGHVRGDVALDDAGWPPRTRQFGNAYNNQFEMPLLFIAAVILAIVVRQAGTVFVVVEWVFVAARLAHAFVHVTSNVMRLRGLCFAASAACVGLLWLLIALGVYRLA